MGCCLLPINGDNLNNSKANKSQFGDIFMEGCLFNPKSSAIIRHLGERVVKNMNYCLTASGPNKA